MLRTDAAGAARDAIALAESQPDDLSAWELVDRVHAVGDGFSQEERLSGRLVALSRMVALDPGDAFRGHEADYSSGLRAEVFSVITDLVGQRPRIELVRQAVEAIDEAIRLHPEDFALLATEKAAGLSLMDDFFDGRPLEELRELRRDHWIRLLGRPDFETLVPNAADRLGEAGTFLLWAGRPELAGEAFRRAHAVDPSAESRIRGSVERYVRHSEQRREEIARFPDPHRFSPDCQGAP